MEFQEEKATVALGAKRVEVWSPWKPDLEYQDRCVRWIVWRTTEALDGADLKEDDASVSGSVLRCCPEVLLGPGMSRAKVTVQPRWRAHSTGVRFSSSTLSSTSGHSNHCNSRHGLVEVRRPRLCQLLGFLKRQTGTWYPCAEMLAPSGSHTPHWCPVHQACNWKPSNKEGRTEGNLLHDIRVHSARKH
ncbi:uncharacterized protein isoform X6 [Takifugu rubripes]|uniref:uncharacterized protein isoform X6 n=1 Tax=Takifugu rubripes TaxID=31033 RepID=UPI001145BFA1|nr:uncharacterized protein LOC105417747 isoform X6 [Takifugu rubripes]